MWQGSKQCCFLVQEKVVHHLFISCLLAKLLWLMIHVTFNVPPPTSMLDMFGNWLGEVEHKAKSRICVGVILLCFGFMKLLK